MVLIAVVAGLLLVAAVMLVARAIVLPDARMSDRLRTLDAYGFGGEPVADEPVRRAPLSDLVRTIGRLLAKRFSWMGEKEVRDLLMAAAMYRTNPHMVLGWRVVGLLGLPVLFFLLGREQSPSMLVLLILLGGAFGWMAPVTLLKRRAQQRLNRIELSLPELIDLMVISVESGMTFSGSMQMAARRLEGPLGDELRLTLQEQSMGLSSRDALQNLLERAETPNMRSFVRSVVQGEALGVSIGVVLRNLAVDMRKRRRASAEAKAQKAPVKILFPLVFLMFPALFVVLLGPAGMQVMDGLGGVK